MDSILHMMKIKWLDFALFLQIKKKTLTGNIGELAVIPEYQHRGIGSVLLSQSLELLQKMELKKITIGVDGENEKAMKLYKKFGFQVQENLTQKFYRMK